MAAHVAFLRAINVAGHGSVKMDDLRKAFTAAGCREVRSYIQSGNVIYESPAPNRAALEKRIRAKVGRLMGGEAVIMFRTIRELEALVASEPFKNVRAGADVKRYVAFLAGCPGARPSLPLTDRKEKLELRGLSGRHAIVVSRKKPNGFYGFPNALVERELAVPATSRNWNTVTRLVKKFGHA